MASSDEIERIMRRHISEEQRRRDLADQDHARRVAAGAEAARGFVELMLRHNVAPEIVYRHRQVKKVPSLRWLFPRPDTYFEQFVPVHKGWVVSFNDYDTGQPCKAVCLRRDALALPCDVHTVGSTGFPTKGLMASPPRTAFGAGKVLCIEKVFRNEARQDEQPYDPTFSLEQYAAAARWYLD